MLRTQHQTFWCRMKIDIVSLKIYREYEFDLESTSAYVYSIEEAGPIFNKLIGNANLEEVGVLCLDSTFRIVNFSIVALGKIDSVRVSISQLIKIALLSNASKIIVGHNHPSGILKVTSKDIDMTQKIGAITRWMDIELLDSIVVNGTESVSIREIIEGEKNE